MAEPTSDERAEPSSDDRSTCLDLQMHVMNVFLPLDQLWTAAACSPSDRTIPVSHISIQVQCVHNLVLFYIYCIQLPVSSQLVSMGIRISSEVRYRRAPTYSDSNLPSTIRNVSTLPDCKMHWCTYYHPVYRIPITVIASCKTCRCRVDKLGWRNLKIPRCTRRCQWSLLKLYEKSVRHTVQLPIAYHTQLSA